MIEELASWTSKLSKDLDDPKRKFAGVTYKKVAGSLKAEPNKVSSGRQVSHLPGLGDKSVKKIDEFLNTGSSKRLVKYRNGDYS